MTRLRKGRRERSCLAARGRVGLRFAARSFDNNINILSGPQTYAGLNFKGLSSWEERVELDKPFGGQLILPERAKEPEGGEGISHPP